MTITGKDVAYVAMMFAAAAFISGAGSVFNGKIAAVQSRVSALEMDSIRQREASSSATRDVESLRAASRSAANPARPSPPPPEAPGGPVTPPREPIPVPGDVVVVRDVKAGGAYLAKAEAWDEFQGACSEEDEAKSEATMTRLDDAGKVILEENGTSLEILQGRFFTYKVRVLDGRHRGWEGWIPRGLVVKKSSHGGG